MFASPWWTMYRIVNAAEDGDREQLEELVDFEVLREGMHEDLRASRDDGDTDLLDRIGDAVVTTAGGAAIDTFATPGGLAVLMDASHVAPGEDYSWDVEREGLNAFRAVSTTESGDPGPQLLFERRGLSWQMVGVRV
ncbi:MAG: DUF2939 domain-containing protein [Erythrobacter sp.]|nr:DUF2939 domain-containing protein [Erythrobacter sp.]